ncbi:hypothetical protein [Nocardiopsis flavescens]
MGPSNSRPLHGFRGCDPARHRAGAKAIAVTTGAGSTIGLHAADVGVVLDGLGDGPVLVRHIECPMAALSVVKKEPM